MPDEDWKSKLSPQEFQVCRLKGTEAPFSGEYYTKKDPGTYLCKCCHVPLFSSDTKYESGSGWPSFFQPIEGNVAMHTDSSHGMERTEVVCKKCGAHLGHVFDDGPRPTGKRYCINSVSLKFRPLVIASAAKQPTAEEK